MEACTTSYINREPFYFARHGETDFSMKDITMGPIDLSLSNKGIKDAQDAAEIFASRPDNYVIISSELKRAKQTAKIISDKINIPVQTFPECMSDILVIIVSLQKKSFYKVSFP